jgi:hypothetical protein
MKLFIALTLNIVILSYQNQATACEGPPISTSAQFIVNSDLPPDSVEPAGELEIIEWKIEREENDGQYDSGCGQATCAPEASFGFKVEVNEQQAQNQGYIVRDLQPGSMYCDPCDQPIKAIDGWIWVSSFYKAKEDITRTFSIAIVNQAGDEGPTTTIDVFDLVPGGCSSSSGTGSSLLGLFLFILVLEKYLFKVKNKGY